MRVLPVACLVLLAGCRSILGIDEADPPRAECATSDDCADPTPVCLRPEGTCVQCTTAEAAACPGAAPICSAAHTCVACNQHADCASQACLPDGSCANEAEVAYVDGGAPATATACTRTAPCHQLAQALALIPARPYIKALTGTVTESGVVSISNREVTIVADPKAVLGRAGTGDCLRIEGGNVRVTIQDLALSNVAGGGAVVYVRDGEVSLDRVEISNNGGTAVRVQGGALRMSRSRVIDNAQGGLSVESSTAVFEVVGNVFAANGNPGTSSGGVRIKPTQLPTNRLELNSFYGNLTGSGGAAIDCDGQLVARNNLVSGPPVVPPDQQIGGTCAHAYSIFFQLPNGNTPAGSTNRTADPMFADPVGGDLHVRAGSPALGAADPATVLDALSRLDIDGDPRTRPADIGADEVP